MSVHPRTPTAARSNQGPSRLDAVLRSGQARRAAELRTGANPNLHPPLNITELLPELKQLVTKHLAASNTGNATALCSDLQAWCRTHPVACEDPDMWRAAFEAMAFPPPRPVLSAPPPLPPMPRKSDFGLPTLYNSDSESYSDSEDDGPGLPQPGGAAPPSMSAEARTLIERRDAYRAAMDEFWTTKLDHDAETKEYEWYAYRVAKESAQRAALAANPPALFRVAFTTACMAIDQVRNGNPNAILNVHPALLQSETFIQSVATVDARVIRLSVGMPDNVKRNMWRVAIDANLSNLRHAVINNIEHHVLGDIYESDVTDICLEKPDDFLRYLPPDYVPEDSWWGDRVHWAVMRNPSLLQFATRFRITDDECFMLMLAKRDGQSLEYMKPVWRSNKRIVLAALKSEPDAYRHVIGNRLRRDPDIREAAGLKPFPDQPRVPRNRDQEVPCPDDDPDDDADSDADADPDADADSDADDEPESPTPAVDAILRAKTMDDSSSDEEAVTHDMDAANVRLDETEDWEEGAPPPRSPVRGDYPPYDQQRWLKYSWSRVGRS